MAAQTCPIIGTNIKLTAKPESEALWSNGRAFEIQSESLTLAETLFDASGLRGTRTRAEERLVVTQKAIGGQISMYISPSDLKWWLPYILGGTPPGSTPWTPDDTLPELDVMVDRVGDLAGGGTDGTFEYGACVVSQAVFTGSEGQPITMTLDIIGKEHTSDAGSDPAIALGTGAEYAPFLFPNSALLYQATQLAYNSFTLTINNQVEPRYGNNLLPVTTCPRGQRLVTLALDGDWSDTYATNVYEVQDVTGAFSWTGSGESAVWTLNNLKHAEIDPATPDENELQYSITLEALASGAGDEVSVAVS